MDLPQCAPGDSLKLKASVLETRISKSGFGILRWRLFNQAGAEVLDLEATSLFKI